MVLGVGPRPGADEPPGRLAARLIVAGLAVGALVPAAIGAARSAHAGAYAALDYDRPANRARPEREVVRRMEFLGAELDRLVPARSRVWLDEPDDLWRLRLQELSTMHGLVLAGSAAGADMVLRLRADPAAPHGVVLEVTPGPR